MSEETTYQRAFRLLCKRITETQKQGGYCPTAAELDLIKTLIDILKTPIVGEFDAEKAIVFLEKTKHYAGYKKIVPELDDLIQYLSISCLSIKR